jgi:dUTP pyrophosphatase
MGRLGGSVTPLEAPQKATVPQTGGISLPIAMNIRVPILAEDDAWIPTRASDGAAGMDLRARIDIVLEPGERAAVPTGIRIAVPTGYEGQVRMRSGLALNKGLTVPNAPGTIDSDYRGEVKVILLNAGSEAVTIARGDRIAQLVVSPVVDVEWEVSDELPGTPRGEAGFGSTGVAGEALR